MATYIMKVMRHEGSSPARLFAFCEDGARVVTLDGAEGSTLQRVGSVADDRTPTVIEAKLTELGYVQAGTFRVVDGNLHERLVDGLATSVSATLALPATSTLLPLSEGWQSTVRASIAKFNSVVISESERGLRIANGDGYFDIIARDTRFSPVSMMANKTTPVLTLAFVVIAEAFEADVVDDQGNLVQWKDVAESASVRSDPDALAVGRALGRFAPELKLLAGARINLFNPTTC